jgi:hypothetical protein
MVVHAPRMARLHDVEIDWGWGDLTERERLVVRTHEALLQANRTSHTIESAERALLAAAADLPGRSLRMRAVDDELLHHWQIVEGELFEGGEFDDEGMFRDELTAEDFRAAGVTVVRTPLAFPESMLHTIRTKAASPLSIVVQDAWATAADELPAGFRTPTGPRRMHAIDLPVDIWAEIKERARSEERSMSYLVQRAVTAAYALPVE